LAGVQESRVSHTLSDLRDFGYIASTIHATNRRRRIHRIIYNERDKNWDRGSRDTCPPGQVSEGRYLTKTGPILDKIEGKSSKNDSKDLSLGTYVRTYKKDKDSSTGDRTDCAEARNRSAVTEAEKYLTELEALAASSDRDNLKFERGRIAQLVEDACLPEKLNERAARLLSQIPGDR
jgi:hypothetical protein